MCWMIIKMLGWMVLTSICITTTNEMTSWIKTKPEIIALFLTNSTDGWICNYSIPFIVLNESCCFGDMRTAVRHVVNKKCRGFLLIPKIFRKCVKACLRFFFYSKKIQIELRKGTTSLLLSFILIFVIHRSGVTRSNLVIKAMICSNFMSPTQQS